MCDRKTRRFRKPTIAEKKRHTVKSLVIANRTRQILFLTRIVAGSTHDYALMKAVFDPTRTWFEHSTVWLDLGFLGAVDDYGKKATICLPHKRPRKSKHNPDPMLTPVQKKANKRQAAIRVIVEHAIGGMKTFHCLMHRIRNHLDYFVDYFFALSAGLWNFKISQQTKA